MDSLLITSSPHLVESRYLMLDELYPDTDDGAIESIEIVRVVDGSRELSEFF